MLNKLRLNFIIVESYIELKRPEMITQECIKFHLIRDNKPTGQTQFRKTSFILYQNSPLN